MGWEKVCVNYSGAGDSCDDFEVRFFKEKDAGVVPFDRLNPGDLEDADFSYKDIREDLWKLLPSGFENNEGGSGAITLTTATGKISVSHDEYYTESHHTEEEY
jgi:hypothetical protein